MVSVVALEASEGGAEAGGGGAGGLLLERLFDLERCLFFLSFFFLRVSIFCGAHGLVRMCGRFVCV